MSWTQRLSLWLWPADKRAQSVRALCEKNREITKDRDQCLKRAIDAEKLLTDLIIDSQARIRDYDHSHNTQLHWRVRP